MVVACDVCREVVHVQAGYYVRHGVHSLAGFRLCSGSGRPYAGFLDSCCDSDACA